MPAPAGSLGEQSESCMAGSFIPFNTIIFRAQFHKQTFPQMAPHMFKQKTVTENRLLTNN